MKIRIVTQKYLNTSVKDTQLKVEVYYSRGGWNFATGEDSPRGYWLSVQPVSHFEVEGVKMESVTLGTGLKKFLTETKADRSGGKAEQTALMLAKEFEPALVEKVCMKEKLSLAA